MSCRLGKQILCIHEMIDSTKETLSGNPAREEFLRRTDEAAKWEQKFDLLGEHYRRFIALINNILILKWTDIMFAWAAQQFSHMQCMILSNIIQHCRMFKYLLIFDPSRFCYFTIFSAGNVAEYNQCVWGQYQVCNF